MLAAAVQYGSEQWLFELQLALVVCWVGVAVVAMLQWKTERPDKPQTPGKPAPSNYYCRKHGKTEDICAPLHTPEEPDQ